MVYVADTARVDKFSKIKGDARVEGNVVLAHSEAMGSAVISGSAKATLSLFCDEARVEGNAVLENVSVRDSAVISGMAQLRFSEVEDDARVYGKAILNGVYVFGNSCVFGDAQLFSNVFVVELCGDCKFGGSANFDGLDTAEDFARKYGSDKVELVDGRIVLVDVWDMG